MELDRVCACPFLVIASITSCSSAMTVPHAAQTSLAAGLADTFEALSYGSRPLWSIFRTRGRTLFSSMSISSSTAMFGR